MSKSPSSLNPFPGLRPFRQDEDYLFFGREAQTLELLQRLGGQRFVAVVGTSGSGKSSLVRCGLLSELLGGKLLQAGASWQFAVTHPGGNPLALLSESLLDADLYDRDQENSRENLLATLSRSHFGLVEAIKQAGLGPETNFLLVVDQFEELFRFHEAGQTQQEMANEFVSVLLEAAAQKDVPIYVVLTMRSDFIGECGQFEGLAEMVNRGEFLIPRLTREEYKRVIEGPIKVAGGKITPRLLQRLLNDLGQQADQLPCLQHALMRTWSIWSEKGNAEALDLDDYQRVGRMAEALSLHADEVYESLADDRQRELCQGIFQALTVQESENRGIRRPQRLGTLCDILEVSREELLPIIDAYRRQGVTFLMPSSDVKLDDQTIIDISHESLMRVWTRLRHWVADEAQAAGIDRRLSESAGLYQQGKAGLYRDPELGIALSWRETRHPNQAWAARYHPGFQEAMRFLDASQQANLADQEVQERARQHELDQVRMIADAERQRAESENRAAKRLRGMVAGLGLVATLALVSSIVAFNYWRTALAAKGDAELSEQSARRNAEAARLEATRATEQESAATVARRDAEQNLTSARKAIDQFLIKVSDSQLLSTPGLQPLRAELLASASGFYEDFLNQNPDDPQLQAGLADAFYRVGFVNNDLGHREQALEALRKSIDLWNAALNRKPDDATLRHGLANAWYQSSIAHILGTGDYDRAEELARNAARSWIALIEAHPENADYKKSLARAYNIMGLAGTSQKDGERSFLAYQQSLKIRLELLPDHPDDVELVHGLAESFNNLASLMGDRELRFAMLQRSIEFNIEAHRLRPQNVEYAMDLSIGYTMLAQNLLTLSRQQEALSAYRSGVDHMLRFIQANPAVPTIRTMLFSSLNSLRLMPIEQKQADEYLRIFRDVRNVFAGLERKTADDHLAFAQIESDYARQITQARSMVQERPLSNSESTEIEALRKSAVESLRQAVAAGFLDAPRLKQDPLLSAARAQPSFAEIVASIEAQGAASGTAKKDPNPSAGISRIADDRIRLEQDRATSFLAFGTLEAIFGRNQQAQQSLEQALNIRQKLADGAPDNEQLQLELHTAQNQLAGLYWRTGRIAKGREYYQQLIASLEKLLSIRPEDKELATQSATVYRSYADSLAGVALWDEAAPLYATSLKLRPKTGISEYHEILDPARLLLTGETQAYRTACGQILEKFGANTNHELTARVARLCSLLPDAVNNPASVLTLAEKNKTSWHAYTWALALYRAGQFEEAIKAIEDARSRGELTGFTVDHFVLAMAHFRAGRQDRAREFLNGVNRQSPQSMPAWTRESDNMLDVDWLVLRREANELIYSSPFSVQDRQYRSRAYAQLGDPEKAEAECAILLQARPDDLYSLADYASVLAELGNKEQAALQLDKLNEKSLATATDVEFWRTYGDALFRLGRHDDASLALRHAIALQTLASIKTRSPSWYRSRLIELYDKLNEVFEAASRPEDAVAARKQLDLTLAACKLPPVFHNAADLLSDSARPNSTQANPIAEIDQLLAVTEKSFPDQDPIFLHFVSRLHELRAETLQDAERTEQEIVEEIAQSCEHYERLLNIDPRNVQAASALSNLLLSRGQVSWKTLEPLELQSKSGTTLTSQVDGSILASGTNPVQETYTVVTKPEISRATAVRLETLPHPSLPYQGSGRDPSGWFYLVEFTVAVAQPGDKPTHNPTPLKLQHAVASFHRKEANGAEYPIQFAIDGQEYGWDVWPEIYQRQEAVFEIQPDPQRKMSSPLVIQLSFLGRPTNPGSLGRFRLSVTEDPIGFQREQQRLQALRLADPWARLGVAWTLKGATAKAVTAFAAGIERVDDYGERKKIVQSAADHDDVLAELLKLRGSDPLLHAAVAERHSRRGEKDLAAAARNKARTLFEQQLAANPDKEFLASGLADLLNPYHP